MLDFQLLRAEKISKDITWIHLRNTINEVTQMLKFSAKNNGIFVVIEYKHKDLESNPNYKIKTDCSRL